MPAGSVIRGRRAQDNIILRPIDAVVVRLIGGPKSCGRHRAAAVRADKAALTVRQLSYSDPDGVVDGSCSGDGALVLLRGTGHGQVGAQLAAPALRLSVVGSLVQQQQAAAGAELVP